MTLLPSIEDDTFVRKLTKSRPLFFARHLAADSPRARTAAPDGGGDREGERAQCRDGGGRPSFARQRAAGWELGRKEGGKEKRERKERRSLALLLLLRRRRRRRPTGKTIINHIGFDRRRERERHSLHRGWQHAARRDAATDGQAATLATELCRASVVRCVVASRPHLRITQRAMQTERQEQNSAKLEKLEHR